MMSCFIDFDSSIMFAGCMSGTMSGTMSGSTEGGGQITTYHRPARTWLLQIHICSQWLLLCR